jgi:hypothetical protein
VGNKKKSKKKVKAKKEYPSNIDGRAKEASAIEPPEKNEYKMDNENNIDQWLRYRPKIRDKYDNLKQKSRLRNK